MSIPRAVIVGVVAVILAGAGGYGLGRRGSEHSTARASTPAPETVTTRTTTSTTSPTSTTTTSTVVPGPAGPFAGEWYHHGFTMALDPTGHGVMQFRLYKDCRQDPPPCDVSVGNGLYDGGFATFTLKALSSDSATGTIEITTDSGVAPRGAFTATYDSSTDLLMLDLPGQDPLAMCGPRAADLNHPPPCGA